MRILPLAVALTTAFAQTSWAFCGFYVATSDQPMFNSASRVVLAHTANHTMVTMSSDVHGDPKQFAIVIPVPTVITKEQVQIVSPNTVYHLAEFTKPRLVEYYDANPCPPPPPPPGRYGAMARPAAASAPISQEDLVVEAQYSVGEYDIVVLSATESTGLMSYLTQHHYRIPPAAQPTIDSYIRQHMHFFLAKVNLAWMAKNGTNYLRPIRVEYNSPKFMLPIRLGTVNATGPQDMIVLALTEKGRVETTNYRTARMPTGVDIPLFVQQQFGQFYDATFDRQVEANGGDAVFLEYAWNIGSMMCDPCSATPMAQDELRELGANWVQADPRQPWATPGPLFVTRLHVRYDRSHFPEDLQLQETPDQENFQVRFVTHHPSSGDLSCQAGQGYKAMLARRSANEATTLAGLSGWTPGLIGRMQATGELVK